MKIIYYDTWDWKDDEIKAMSVVMPHVKFVPGKLLSYNLHSRKDNDVWLKFNRSDLNDK